MDDAVKRVLIERARRFLDFKSVAVIGASNGSNRIGGRPLALLRSIGFEGDVFGVNPKYSEVQGYPCFTSIDELPMGVELAIMAVAAPLVVEAMPSLAARGVQAMTIFSSGFGEAGDEGVALQRALYDGAVKYQIAVNGPNCLGSYSFSNRRPATFASAMGAIPWDTAGSVALVSQSGGFATNIWGDAVLNGARFSHMIMTGNESVLSFGDFLSLLIDDPETSAVLGYIEGISDGRALCQAAEGLRRAGKPLVLIKSGRTTEAARVVASHTGQLAGDGAAFHAAFRKHGVIEAVTLEDLTDHARALSRTELRDPISVATTSGGAGVYITDICKERGVRFAELHESTVAALSEIVPSFGTTTNPVDLTAQVVNDSTGLENALHAMARDENTGTVLFILSGKAEPERAREVIDIVLRVEQQSGTTIPMAWLGVPGSIRSLGSEAGLMVLTDPARLVGPLANLRAWAQDRTDAPWATAEPTLKASIDSSMAHVSIEGATMLDEASAMDLLEGAGLRTPRRWIVEYGDGIDELRDDVTFPCVAKMLHPVALHKARNGGVRIGIRDQDMLRAEVASMASGGAVKIILEEQVASFGPELIFSVTADATFGQRITIGTGGAWTNTDNDFTTLLPPLTLEYVQKEVDGLRLAARLEPLMGENPDLMQSIANFATRLSEALAANSDVLFEIECNPVLITASGLVAVDAVATFR